jgi:hypothetical protein
MGAIPRLEALMDNRLNKIRKEMNVLRADMLRAEGVIRDQVNHDQDCTQAATRVMAMRARMSALVREWQLLGGIAHLPTVEERLKGRRGPRPGSRAVRLPSNEKHRAGARA